MQSAWTERGSLSVPGRGDMTTKLSAVGEGTEVGMELEKEGGERARDTRRERKSWRETERGDSECAMWVRSHKPPGEAVLGVGRYSTPAFV